MNQLKDTQNYNNGRKAKDKKKKEQKVDGQDSKTKKYRNANKKSNTYHKKHENRKEEKKTRSLPKLSLDKNQHRRNQRMVVKNQNGGQKDDQTAVVKRDTLSNTTVKDGSQTDSNKEGGEARKKRNMS